MSPRRRRWFWFLATILVPVLLLALLELGLRLGGYGYETGFFVRHPAAPSGHLVENQRFSWRFFTRPMARYPRPVLVAHPKPAGTYRIFVLGESAAQGDPDPVFSFSRILQVLLRERYPGARIEVINLAFTAINSHVVLPIATDCASLQGDLWLVYMGNNEVVGPYGAGSPFGRQSPPLSVLRASLAFKATRTGQLMDDMIERFLSKAGPSDTWGGMPMMLEHQVREDDLQMKRVYAYFQKNLRDILNVAKAAGTKVIVSTLVANLRDCPPFGSLHRADLTDARRIQWEQAYQAGVAAETAGKFEAAIAKFREASQIDDTFAELHFRWGRCCLSLGKQSDAKAQFERARDLDTLRFRADGRLNEIVRQAVAKAGTEEIRLLDAKTAFSQQSRDGIVGNEWLYEHVHFHFEGNYLLARLFADQIAQALPERITGSAGRDGSWLSAADCAQRLALTDYSRYWAAEFVRRRMSEPPFTAQLDHAERLQRQEEYVAKLLPRTKIAGMSQAARLCRQALSQAEDDWVLHDLLGFLTFGAGDNEGAIAQWRRVNELMPHFASAYCEAAKVREGQGRTEEATALFSKSLWVNPDYSEAHFGLGMLWARQGDKKQATHHLRETLRLNPAKAAARSKLEKLLAGQ